MKLAALIGLLACLASGVALRWRHNKPTSSETLCPSHPYPIANATELLSKLQPFLDESSKNMSEALAGSPGGAVVNVVYKDTVIWTQGFGLINMSGISNITAQSIDKQSVYNIYVHV